MGNEEIRMATTGWLTNSERSRFGNPKSEEALSISEVNGLNEKGSSIICRQPRMEPDTKRSKRNFYSFTWMVSVNET